MCFPALYADRQVSFTLNVDAKPILRSCYSLLSHTQRQEQHKILHGRPCVRFSLQMAGLANNVWFRVAVHARKGDMIPINHLTLDVFLSVTS